MAWRGSRAGPAIWASPVSPIFPIGIGLFFLCHMLTILLMFVLMPLYIILAVRDERHDQTTRIVWIILICMMGNLAMPVYWYLYVWPARPAMLSETS